MGKKTLKIFGGLRKITRGEYEGFIKYAGWMVGWLDRSAADYSFSEDKVGFLLEERLSRRDAGGRETL